MKKLSILLVIALLVTVFAGCQSIANTGGNGSQTPPAESTQLPPAEENSAPPAAESTAPVGGEPTADVISREEAKKIALDHAKVKEADIRDLDIELDKDAGTLHYDVDFEVGGKDYDYEIDAVTGKILKSEKERD